MGTATGWYPGTIGPISAARVGSLDRGRADVDRGALEGDSPVVSALTMDGVDPSEAEASSDPLTVTATTPTPTATTAIAAAPKARSFPGPPPGELLPGGDPNG
ncbi:hypothetical protein FMUAM8_03220 [Nocardia cyriacigeorgica]|nr:hypothetical protein FMUAM8_03220 [Nocardia cyriacigeorgica]